MLERSEAEVGVTRRFVLAAPALSAGACASLGRSALYEAARPMGNSVFAHGVASGDPAVDSVILWTRASPRGDEGLDVVWEVATDEGFVSIVQAGAARATAARDWTVKAEAAGLLPGQDYFYRFRAAGAVSPIGRTRTLPMGAVESLRFAVVSCANHALGYFNVYDHIARGAFDAVLHLGDYIYEYGPGGYDGAAELPDRAHEPAHETVTLADYRARHAQYKRDASLQAMHAAHPVIAIWDDHEAANDSWAEGGENHQPEEGAWGARRAAALQAYEEWMPVRPFAGAARFAHAAYGDLATLVVLETRLHARDRAISFNDLAALATQADAVAFLRDVVGADQRGMLGAEQLTHVRGVLEGTRRPWMLIANQTLMAQVKTPDVAPYLTPETEAALRERWSEAEGFLRASRFGLPLSLDSWDGYPAERERLYAAARAAGVGDLLVLTGDTHTWWANDLTCADGAPIGVELGAASVTSPSPLSEEMAGSRATSLGLLVNRENPAVRYVSGRSHGYLDLTLGREAGRATFVAVDTIMQRRYRVFREASFRLVKQDGRLRMKGPRGLSLFERFLF
jgi:phosphodiesterase/alkaline phosphatase D-like protein